MKTITAQNMITNNQIDLLVPITKNVAHLKQLISNKSGWPLDSMRIAYQFGTDGPWNVLEDTQPLRDIGLSNGSIVKVYVRSPSVPATYQPPPLESHDELLACEREIEGSDCFTKGIRLSLVDDISRYVGDFYSRAEILVALHVAHRVSPYATERNLLANVLSIIENDHVTPEVLKKACQYARQPTTNLLWELAGDVGFSIA